MTGLVEVIAKALVDYPDAVDVRETLEKDGTVLIELRVDEKDMGKVIGRQGKIAKAFRMVVKAAAIKENKKIRLEIIS